MSNKIEQKGEFRKIISIIISLIKKYYIMEGRNLFGVDLPQLTKEEVLEKIKKGLKEQRDFFHIVSLNPENFVIAQENELFKKVLQKAQLRIIDGIGVVLAARILNLRIGERITGVDLMEELIQLAGEQRLKVLLIGGKEKLANDLSICYQKLFPKAKFIGIEGVKNIKKVKFREEKKIFSIVSLFKPHLVFVAFGSPYQELWLWKNRKRLKGCICLGVGGGFDFLSGRVIRAPLFLRRLGLEWLFRLSIQPWRFKRQLRLIKFLFLVFKEKGKRIKVNF